MTSPSLPCFLWPAWLFLHHSSITGITAHLCMCIASFIRIQVQGFPRVLVFQLNSAEPALWGSSLMENMRWPRKTLRLFTCVSVFSVVANIC